MKDAKPLLLLLMAIGLIATWIYHLYDKNEYSKRRTEVYIKDSAAIADGIRDSLTRMFSSTIRDLDQQLDSSRQQSDSLQGDLQQKLHAIQQLRTDIAGLLKKGKTSPADLEQARKKIRELQDRVEELRSRNRSLEEEKDRLSGLLDQLSNEVRSMEQNMRRLDSDNHRMALQINAAATFIASDINIAAIDVRGTREHATSQARKTDAINVSFVLQNLVSSYASTPVFVKLIDPKGKVLPGDAGEGFTRRLIVNYEKGERKEMGFSYTLNENAVIGTYQLQIWHNNLLVGERKLSLK